LGKQFFVYLLGISLFVADSFAMFHVAVVVAELMSAVLDQQGHS
jgi:hypothetical protein